MNAELPVNLQRAKAALAKRLADQPGFVGIGISRNEAGQYEIIVMVVEQTSAVRTKVPSRWQGIPVRTQVGGVPRKF